MREMARDPERGPRSGPLAIVGSLSVPRSGRGGRAPVAIVRLSDRSIDEDARLARVAARSFTLRVVIDSQNGVLVPPRRSTPFEAGGRDPRVRESSDGPVTGSRFSPVDRASGHRSAPARRAIALPPGRAGAAEGADIATGSRSGSPVRPRPRIGGRPSDRAAVLRSGPADRHARSARSRLSRAPADPISAARQRQRGRSPCSRPRRRSAASII